MNNRQSALIAASGLSDSAHRAAHVARLLEVWLDELDAAEAERRVPAEFGTVRQTVEAAADLERIQGSPVVKFHFIGEQPSVDLANGNGYDWYGSWSRSR